ncbi:hypothetical protein Aoki45_16590 [Algoriphagus sp. oki45]|uniref:hypothetical protein n=1 Tax=Algoriphagus sp. oki45 TaxID=3067294 RepID=UPI0027EEE55B|nr:hypothetical protein Aoki45_16590 [Algoriphagus sp. oki45]
MKRITLLLLILLFSSSTGILLAQNSKNRVVPGKMYNSGEEVYSPKYGFTATIPAGWVGVLPRETEVFLLNSTTGVFGEIFVFGREKIDLNELSRVWQEGVNISETISLKAAEPKIEGDILFSQVEAAGNYVAPKNYRAFAATRCGEACITVLAISMEENAEMVSQSALELLKTATLTTAREVDVYEGFDWKEFLSDKLLIAYEGFVGGKQQTKVNLCSDGGFNANISKKGIMKDSNPEYKGTMKGQWKVESEGSKATLTLTFEKKGLAPVTVNLEFINEELYANGERHYASKSEKCF